MKNATVTNFLLAILVVMGWLVIIDARDAAKWSRDNMGFHADRIVTRLDEIIILQKFGPE